MEKTIHTDQIQENDNDLIETHGELRGICLEVLLKENAKCRSERIDRFVSRLFLCSASFFLWAATLALLVGMR